MAKSATPKKPAAKSKLQKVQIAPRPAKKRADKRGTPKGAGTMAGGRGGRIGNPPHVPTPELRKLAETHAAVGTPHWAIAIEMSVAAGFNISEDTLERHYKRELDLGLIRMNARVGSNIAKKALDGDSDMEKFWMARRGGAAWANKQQTELSGPRGGPIETRDMTKLSEAELRVLAKLDAAK